MNLKPLLNPKCVAVVGASRERAKLGHRIFQNCTRYGYRGRVYPVNPKATRIGGVTCYPTLQSIPARVDCAIIATPAATIPAILEDAVRAKVGSVVVISAGFGESGAPGKLLERKVRDIARRARLPLVGPNCLGIVLPHRKLNASFADGLPATGGVSVLSQSGAIAVAQMDWAATHKLGFRSIVSLGNKAVLSEADMLEALAADPGTRVILLYLEDVREGRRFLQTAQRVASRKPIIILRSGKSTQGARAAQSHTGALAGSSQLTDAVLRQAGCIVVETIADWLNFAAACDQLPRPRGNRLAILTNAGGPGILATDALTGSSLQLATFSPKTLAQLKRALPPAAALHNPVDVIGDAPPERYLAALRNIVADPRVDMVVATITDQLTTRSRAIASGVIALARVTRKPILTSFIGGKRIASATSLLRNAGIPTFPFPDVAVRAADALVTGTRPSNISVLPIPTPHAPLRTTGSAAVGEQARAYLLGGGVRVLPSYRARSADHAVRLAARLRYPVVMKVDATTILHKTDRGAVVLDLHTPAMVRAAYARFRKKFAATLAQPSASVVVQDQRGNGVEVFLGAVRDPQFGPVLLLGFGGIYVEALRSVAYATAPLRQSDARTFLEHSPAWAVLRGARGQSFASAQLVRLIVQVGTFIARHPDVQSIDCNPVLVTARAATILDARLTFARP